MLTLLTTIPLLFAITQAPSLDPSEDPSMQAPAPALEQPEYDAALLQLEEADMFMSTEPLASPETLANAITALEEFAPTLAGDAEARTSRQYARLNLARAHQQAKRDELAAQVMDEAIRAAMGDLLPAADFGPSLEDLYTQRLDALEQLGRASLVVRCEMPCKVYVDERELGPEPPPLLLGSYRVWIEDTTGKRSATREQVELSEVGHVYELEFAPIRPPVRRPPPPPPPTRIMPRWAEIALIVTGVGLTTTGGVLIGLSQSDGENFKTLNGGAISTIFGVATMLPGVITLSIDERRIAGARGRQAMVNWTMQF